jgi:hypothetical protein
MVNFWVDEYVKENAICPACRSGLKIEQVKNSYDAHYIVGKCTLVNCGKKWQVNLHFREV